MGSLRPGSAASGQLLRLVVVAVAYYASAKGGLAFAFGTRQVSAVWPPTGLALAAVLVWGPGMWPAVAIGAFAANWTTSEPLISAVGIMAGNTLEALVGAALLTRTRDFRPALDRKRDVVGLVALAAVMSTLVSASIGVLSLRMGGVIPAFAWGTWKTWWLGDMGGDLLVTPALLVLSAAMATGAWRALDARRGCEAGAALMALGALTAVVFSSGGVLPYVLFPLLFWIVLRLGQPGAVVASLLLSGLAVWFTAHGHGPFVGGSPDANLLRAQTFVGVVALTAMLTAAVNSERKRAEGNLMISERTAARFREQSELLAGVIDNAPIGKALVSPTGSFLRVNRALSEIVGYDEAELLELTFQEITHPDDLDADLAYIRQMLAGELRTYQMEKRYRHKSGRLVWVKLSVSLLRDDAGAPMYFISQIEDVTRAIETAAELDRSRARLTAAQALARFGSWELDLARDRLVWSDELCRICGQPVGLTPSYDEFIAMVHPEDRAALRQRVQDARAGTFSDSEYRIIRPDGEVRYVHTRRFGRADGTGRVLELWGTTQDITERKLEQLERAQRHGEERALRELSELVAQTAPPAAVFAAAARHVRGLLGAWAGVIVRFDRGAGVATIIASSTTDADGTFDGVDLPLDGVSAIAAVFCTGDPARYDVPPVSDTDPTAEIIRRADAVGAVAAPVIVNGELWGALSCGFTETAPADAEARLGRFAAVVEMAVANATAWGQLAREATTDPLTCLANHRAFYEHLDVEFARAGRYGRDLSLVLLDVDHFKEVNDTHGHLVGDSVLQEIARRLAAVTRDGELIARVGGEEFAWVLPDTAGVAAEGAAERARRAISDVPFDTVGQITVSIGVCDRAHAKSVTELYEYADRALYWAKRRSRNRALRYSADAADAAQGLDPNLSPSG